MVCKVFSLCCSQLLCQQQPGSGLAGAVSALLYLFGTLKHQG